MKQVNNIPASRTQVSAGELALTSPSLSLSLSLSHLHAGICGGTRVDRAQVEEGGFSDTETSAPRWTRAPDYPLLLDCFNWESNQTNTYWQHVHSKYIRLHFCTICLCLLPLERCTWRSGFQCRIHSALMHKQTTSWNDYSWLINTLSGITVTHKKTCRSWWTHIM